MGRDFEAMERRGWSDLDAMGAAELDELEGELMEARSKATKVVRLPANFDTPTTVADIDSPRYKLLLRAGDAIKRRRAALDAAQLEHQREQDRRATSITSAASRMRSAIKLCRDARAIVRDGPDVPEPLAMPDAATMGDAELASARDGLASEADELRRRIGQIRDDADLLAALDDADARAIVRELRGDARSLEPRLRSLDAAVHALDEEAHRRAEASDTYRTLVEEVAAMRDAAPEAIAEVRARVAQIVGGRDEAASEG